MNSFRELVIYTFALSVTALAFTQADAAIVKSKTLEEKAYFTRTKGDLFRPLNLIEKRISFSKADSQACGQTMTRLSGTMRYSCTLRLSKQAVKSQLRQQVTPQSKVVHAMDRPAKVKLIASKDGLSLTASISFDTTGIDLNVSKFNNDLYHIYSKMAQLAIEEALMDGPLILKVLQANP